MYANCKNRGLNPMGRLAMASKERITVQHKFNLNPEVTPMKTDKPKRAYNRKIAPKKIETNTEIKMSEPEKTKRDFPRMYRKRRCGKCKACQNVDCRRCKFCLDKTRYGGKNTWKRPCITRMCQNMVDKKEVKNESMEKDDDIFNSDDEAYWKEFCEA